MGPVSLPVGSSRGGSRECALCVKARWTRGPLSDASALVKSCETAERRLEGPPAMEFAAQGWGCATVCG